MSNQIELKQEGRRLYVIGSTFPIKDSIKAAGGHWDDDAKAWWVGTGKREEFWANVGEVRILKQYREPITIATLERLREKMKDGGGRQNHGVSAEMKRCWECGGAFTKRDAQANGGDWMDSYCGC